MFGGQNQIETLNCFDIVPELCKKISYFTPEEFKRAAYHEKYRLEENKENVREKPIKNYGYLCGEEKRISIGVGITRTNSLENIQY